MTCTNDEDSSDEFIQRNRKRTNEKIKQELHGILLTKREQQVLKRIENDTENNRLRRT